MILFKLKCEYCERSFFKIKEDFHWFNNAFLTDCYYCKKFGNIQVLNHLNLDQVLGEFFNEELENKR